MSNYYNRQWRLPNNENKDKQSNYSMDFDGSSQYIDLGNLDFLNTANAMTISFWFKADDALDSNWHTFLANGSLNPVSNLWCGLTRSNWSSVVDGTSIQPTFSLKINGANSIVGGWGGNITTASPNPIVNGTWYHFCGTWDGSTQKLYIDGQLKGSLSTTGSINTTTNDTYIGASPNPTSYYFDGSIDAVSIYNYALSSSQITTLYGSSSTGIGNPMSLSPKPVAYYPLGDQDAFNGANYLVPNSSLKDYVFSFDGSNDYISASGANLPTGNSSFTASCWFRRNGTQANYAAILSWGASSTREKVIILFAPDGAGLRFGFFADDLPVSDSYATSDNIWYNVVLTYNGSVAKMYINGTLEASHTLGGALNISSSNPLLIGKQSTYEFKGSISNVQIFNTVLPTTGSNSIETLYNNGSPLTSMTGFTSLQGWWKLDASATYNSSTTTWTIPDDSSNSNDGTSSGMNQSALVQSNLSFTNGYSPYALDFDATNDYINVGSFSLNASAGTVSAWVKTSQSSDFQMIVSKSNGGAGSQLQFRTNADGIFRVILNHSSTVTVIDSATAVNDGNWHNLVFTYSSSGMNLYIDGYLNNSNTTSVTSVDSSTESFMIGARKISAPEKFFIGSISNVSVWNTSLTSTQVLAIYNQGLPGNLNSHSAYSNLVSWWQLGENSSYVGGTTNPWTFADEKGTNNATSGNLPETALTNGVGTTANGVSTNIVEGNLLGNAPYSTANAISSGMAVTAKGTDVP